MKLCCRCHQEKLPLINVIQFASLPEELVCTGCLTSMEANYHQVQEELVIISPSTPNPKAAVGGEKISIHSVCPPSGMIETARVMHYGAYEAKRSDGKQGYGPFNWREDGIDILTYLNAIERHVLDIVDGEDVAEDSLCLHFAHIAANCLIAIDAMDLGMMIDNRPSKGGAARLMKKYRKQLKEEKLL